MVIVTSSVIGVPDWLLKAWGLASPYLSQLLLGVVAFIALLKDWNDYGQLSKKWGRSVPLLLAILTIGITLLGVHETYSSRVDQASNEATITQLSTQIGQLRTDNQTTENGFRDSFTKLYNRFSDLQSKVQNAALMKELDDTKKQLVQTQEKLTPPTVAPVASFPANDPASVPITQLTTTRAGDAVELNFIVYNPTKFNAGIGAVTLRLCTLCKYAEEPKGFIKVAGAEETDREFDFQHIWGKTSLQLLTIHFTVPQNITSVQIGVFVACTNCVAPVQQRLNLTLQ